MKYKRSAEAREDFSVLNEKKGTITDYKGRERFEKIILHLIFLSRDREETRSPRRKEISCLFWPPTKRPDKDSRHALVSIPIQSVLSSDSTQGMHLNIDHFYSCPSILILNDDNQGGGQRNLPTKRVEDRNDFEPKH